MQISDFIYGDYELEEPVLIELIESKPMQRLKKISQYGLPKKYYHLQGYSRYEHSIGVMLLLRKLGAEIQEQTAGLIHDVSHTAFSHIADWAIGDPLKEGYQDSIHEKVILRTKISSILKKYGFNPRKMANLENFKLLEQPKGELCADRIDYALREIYYEHSKETAKECFDNLIVHDGAIVFSSKETATKFAYLFSKCHREHWGGPESTIRYYLMSECLKRALNEKIITLEDLDQDDEYVLEKLKSSGNRHILKFLQTLKNKINYKVNLETPQLKLRKKFRYIDPKYLEEGKLKTLSQTDSTYKEFLKKETEIDEKGINVDID
ncbi:MAG: HD domain-containing protein [Candidatus Micrarchaeota archaeon]